MKVKLLTELSFKGGSLESTLVKMPHCWISHVTAHISLAAKNPDFNECEKPNVDAILGEGWRVIDPD